MLLLILTVCTVAVPADCHDTRLQYTDMSPMACMMQGQQVAADFLDQHPGHRIERWRCTTADHEGDPT